MNHPPASAPKTSATGRFTLTALAFGCLVASVPAAAQTMHIETSGRGQALIFPYYTVRNGTVSLMSLVNQTDQAKALRLRVREAIGGRPVAELNLFLSPKDVWTAAFVPTTDGTRLVSNDKSCTEPKISASSSGLVFSSAAFANDGPAYFPYIAADRTREGFIEVIEMASFDYATPLGRDVTHSAGVPPCRITATADAAAIQSTLSAPSGGIVGSMSFINLSDGLGVSYNATAINGFWRTGPGAQVPAITAPVSPSAANPPSAPDLTSGGNTTITVTDKGKTYVSTFARSIDAVSALFMADSLRGEYGFTIDGVFSSNYVISLPTKPYYIYAATAATLAPFESNFDRIVATACDSDILSSVDRDEYVFFGDDFGGLGPPVNRKLCGVSNVYAFRPEETAFSSPRRRVITAIQNSGLDVIRPGKEGGYLRIDTTYSGAKLIPTSSSMLSRSATTGELTWTPVAHTYYGLPMLGFALSVAKYNAGSPQQNFGNLNALTSRRRIE